LSRSSAMNLNGPGAGKRPAAQGGAVSVLLHDIVVALVIDVGGTEAAEGYRLEEGPALGCAALKGHVGEGQPARALVGDHL